MDTNSPIEELVEAKQELLDSIEALCTRRDEIYGDCEVSGAVKALRSELTGLQAEYKQLTEDIQAARKALLAGVQDREVPEIARLTAERVTLVDAVIEVSQEVADQEARRTRAVCNAIEAENRVTAAADQIAAGKREFETWRTDELAALHKQRNELSARHAVHTKEIAAIGEGREELATREAQFDECEKLQDEREARLKSEQRALEQDREHCGAIKIANDKRAGEIRDEAEQQQGRNIDLTDREDALIERGHELTNREAALKQREADLVENWKVLEDTRGQSVAG